MYEQYSVQLQKMREEIERDETTSDAVKRDQVLRAEIEAKGKLQDELSTLQLRFQTEQATQRDEMRKEEKKKLQRIEMEHRTAIQELEQQLTSVKTEQALKESKMREEREAEMDKVSAEIEALLEERAHTKEALAANDDEVTSLEKLHAEKRFEEIKETLKKRDVELAILDRVKRSEEELTVQLAQLKEEQAATKQMYEKRIATINYQREAQDIEIAVAKAEHNRRLEEIQNQMRVEKDALKRKGDEEKVRQLTEFREKKVKATAKFQKKIALVEEKLKKSDQEEGDEEEARKKQADKARKEAKTEYDHDIRAIEAQMHEQLRAK
ncbi:hypothetical protein AAMO2058_000917900 [Amorphochlora amoebiformis]